MRTATMHYEFGLNLYAGEILIAEDVRMDVEVRVEREAVRQRDIEWQDVLDLDGWRVITDEREEPAPKWLAELAMAHLYGPGAEKMVDGLNELATEYELLA